jgi:hypothetical protein
MKTDLHKKGSGDFTITPGAMWPGLAKLMEECAETVQVGAKLVGSSGSPDHWDGTNL